MPLSEHALGVHGGRAGVEASCTGRGLHRTTRSRVGVCDQCRAAAMVQATTPSEGSAHHVTRMQQIVLQWDYYKLTSRANGKEKKKLRELRKVPERFQDIQVGDGDMPCVPSSLIGGVCRAAATLPKARLRYMWELISGGCGR